MEIVYNGCERQGLDSWDAGAARWSEVRGVVDDDGVARGRFNQGDSIVGLGDAE